MADLAAAQNALNTLADPQVVEIMINEDGSVYVERGGGLQDLGVRLDNENALAFLRTLCGPNADANLSKRPYADLLGVEGSRVHVMAPPLVKGLVITIRKMPAARPGLEQLVQFGALSANCAGFLAYAVKCRKNMLFVGGTSSGKTTMMSALLALIPPTERILVIEDTPELTLKQPHVNRMRTRLNDPQGLPDVTLRELVISTLRMRPDRVVIGEVRSTEASDMLQAMNVGQDGMMATIHASSCREALQRLETLVLMAGHDLPHKAVRSNIATALDLIIYLTRTADGKRRIMQVAEVTGMDTDNVTMVDLFKVEGRKAGANTAFDLKPSGAMPKFYDQLRASGVEPPLEFFK